MKERVVGNEMEVVVDTLFDGRQRRMRWRRRRRLRWGLNCCIDGRAKMGLV